MRPIKFRAWDKKNSCWVVNFLIQANGTAIAIADNWNTASYDQREIELEQFTGLLDKNGKEIYEGDIVRLNRNDISHSGPIVYSGASFGMQSQTKWWIHSIEDQAGELEVIGNIHETPELVTEHASR